MALKTTIKDVRVRIRISSQLINVLMENLKYLTSVPENILKILKNENCELPSGVEILRGTSTSKSISTCKIDSKGLDKLLRNKTKPTIGKVSDAEDEKPTEAILLTEYLVYLDDVRWLQQFLEVLRSKQHTNLYLNDILLSCRLELPQNEIIDRNPVLEARCQRLKEEAENRKYVLMTKNVNTNLINYPEDSIAYQIKAINSQMIGVLQLIFSVAAGFVFGFLGIELIVGGLNIGVRLVLGVMFALIIALAEIYFLAKKLHNYDHTVDVINKNVKKHLTTLTTNTKCKTE